MTSSAPPRFEPGSFRDPDTRVFHHAGGVFRGLTRRALADWQRLAKTRFYRHFSEQGRLVGTREVVERDGLPELAPQWAGVLEHARVPVVSYPYEWSFGMLLDAALLQLDLTLAALDEGVTLKDATPFNVQWIGSRPTFIDIGSFTAYEPGAPWAGYRQFCETYLYPLLLQACRNVPFHPWLRGRLDGITAGECRSLLSARDYLRSGVLAHVYLQAKAQDRYGARDGDVGAELRAAGFGAALIRNNVARLRRMVEGLRWTPAQSTWSDYQRTLTYDDADRAIGDRRRRLAWDIGCNTGIYSRMAADRADYVLALDADHTGGRPLVRQPQGGGPGVDPAARGGRCRPVAGPRLAGPGAPPAGGPRCPGPHPLPRPRPPCRHRPQRAARLLRRLAGGVRGRGGRGDRRSRRPDGRTAAPESVRPGHRVLRRGGPRTSHPALRRRHARDDGVRHAHAVPLPPAER